MSTMTHSGFDRRSKVSTKPAGTWTYDDLLSLPDDGRRYEIIEGDL